MSLASHINAPLKPSGRTVQPSLCRRLARAFFVSGVLLALMNCGSGPRTTVRTLSSGKKIRVISIQRVEFNQPPPALVLRYHTDLKLDQKDELQEEVAEIWTDFRKDVEQADLKAAAIIAGEEPSGWPVYRFNTHGFVFTRAPDGTWTQSNAK